MRFSTFAAPVALALLAFTVVRYWPRSSVSSSAPHQDVLAHPESTCGDGDNDVFRNNIEHGKFMPNYDGRWIKCSIETEAHFVGRVIENAVALPFSLYDDLEAGFLESYFRARNMAVVAGVSINDPTSDAAITVRNKRGLVMDSSITAKGDTYGVLITGDSK